MTNLVEATEIAKAFLVKMKGLDILFSGRQLIDWLDFEAIKDNETQNHYDIKCTFQENLFTPNRISFKIRIAKSDGEIVDVQRVNDS